MQHCSKKEPENFYSCRPSFGHMQTVQTQIRCRKLRHLIRVFTVCSQNTKTIKTSTRNPKTIINRLIHMMRMDKSTGENRAEVYAYCTDSDQLTNMFSLAKAFIYCLDFLISLIDNSFYVIRLRTAIDRHILSYTQFLSF